jgi:hypothetical protein
MSNNHAKATKEDNETSLNPNNRDFQQFIQGLDNMSQNHYVRTCERYHTYILFNDKVRTY